MLPSILSFWVQRTDLRANHELTFWGHFLRMSQCVQLFLPLSHLIVTAYALDTAVSASLKTRKRRLRKLSNLSAVTQ